MLFQSGLATLAARVALCLCIGAVACVLCGLAGVDLDKRQLALNDRPDAGLSLVIDLGRLEGRIRVRLGGGVRP